jgi:uncharacterized protein (TIGR03435 family)
MILVRSIFVIAVVGIVAHAQRPAFEAVSIKVNRTTSRSGGVGPRPGGMAATNSTLQGLIQWAWELNSLELVGGPDWIDDVRFDILATAVGTPNWAETRAMARTMLEDRFRLVLRKEMRSLPIYALRLAEAGKLGPSLQRSTTDCGKAWCGSLIDEGTVKSTGITLDDFAKSMANRAGRVIVNQTGLDGAFDIQLKFSPDSGVAGAVLDLPSFFTAVREQLGLRLDAQTGPVEVFVVASAERPSEN